MLSKLKYVGVSQTDLITIYKLYNRSITEYASVVWHSSLTEEQKDDVERTQKVSLRVILGKDYCDYKSALSSTLLESLESRREKRCLEFGLRSIKHSVHKDMFPRNYNGEKYSVRNREKFLVNPARMSYYARSSIPYIQSILNKHFQSRKVC